MPTGEVEVVASKIWILNESRTPPFPMEEHVDVSEDARLKYRYVDLRRPRMQRNIILRSQISYAVFCLKKKKDAIQQAECGRYWYLVLRLLEPVPLLPSA